MKSFNIHEAKTHLSRLIERVEAGEEFIIAKAGRPAAKLVPLDNARKPVKIGGLEERVPLPDDFNTMFEGEIAALFTGGPGPAKATKRK